MCGSTCQCVSVRVSACECMSVRLSASQCVAVHLCASLFVFVRSCAFLMRLWCVSVLLCVLCICVFRTTLECTYRTVVASHSQLFSHHSHTIRTVAHYSHGRTLFAHSHTIRTVAHYSHGRTLFAHYLHTIRAIVTPHSHTIRTSSHPFAFVNVR